MYLKLALRNAKRSMLDYLLYIVSMIMLTSVTCFTNCIANWGDMQAGFQTIALPSLIVVIMVVLVNYINIFIVKQRAREFATYMLFGMEKDKLSLVFLCELLVIGLICFLLGVTLGLGIFAICCCTILQGAGEQSVFQIILKSIIQTLVYFCGVEVFSILFMRRKIYKLQIVQLMSEKQRNQPLSSDKKSFWRRTFVISFSCYIALLFSISSMSNELMTISISFISLPMLLFVFSFYKWLYAFVSFLRLSQADALYQGNRLYRIAQMTTGSKTSANMNTIFSVCIILSAGSFVFGTLMLNSNIHIFEQAEQQWMGFLQISICIIFMIIYFSIIALLQIIDLKRETRNIKLLHHMGKNQLELKTLLYTQTIIRMFLPTLMSFVVLMTAVPFINYKLNLILPTFMCNLTIKAISGFMICFFALYLCYFCVIYMVNTRYIKSNIK